MKIFLFLFILTCWCTQNAWGNTQINCAAGSGQTDVNTVTENYEGHIETINIPGSEALRLGEYNLFPVGASFVELVNNGDGTATVQTTKPLDADVSPGQILYYEVICTVSGMKHVRRINVNDINDNAPVFDQGTYTKTVSEITPVGTDVIRVRAVDADSSPANSQVTYSIQAPVPPVFEIRNDGNIRLTSLLNYNTASQYTFTVEAKDPGGLKDTAVVTISVEDVDNLNPYFDHSLYHASISENQIGPFSSLDPAAIKAQDGDTGINEPVVYSISTVTPNTYQSYFNIDPTTGVITVVTALDREEIETITVQIQATQQNDNSKTANANVLVTVMDVDDNAPEFDETEYSVVIPENSPKDQFVFQAKVTDKDKGGFVGTLRIIPDTTPFSISPDGSVTVKTPAELDRETTASFSFQIEAKEDLPSTHSVVAGVTVTLSDENDNSPAFGRSKYTGEVSADQTIGMQVVKVEATDPDEGPNGEISYFIEFGDEEGHFEIVESTGEIKLKKEVILKENEILRFLLYVTARDGGTISRSSFAMVEISAPGNSRPQFLQRTYEGKVAEETAPGAEIVKMTFLSVAPVVPVTLTVKTEADKFAIDATGKLTTKIKLDYEVRKNYTVQVSLSDGTTEDEASVHVEVLDINDNKPVFATSPIAVTVPENATIGDNVTAVSATDADSGLNAEVRYILEASAGMFSINPETGFITVAAALDRETVDKYDMRVVASDQGLPTQSTEVSVTVTVTDVNDNAPVFAKLQYEASVSEDDAVGTEVAYVNATDKDTGDNAVVTHHITKQEPSSSFTINANTGLITLAQKLDYSKVNKYTLEVEARDGGSPALTSTTTVTVLVKDVNNNPPKFGQDRYDVTVYENVPPGSALISLDVTDDDEDGFSNGHFILDSDTFGINSQGMLHLLSTASLDRETTDNYILKVVAVDQPIDGLNSTAEINITVLDTNDNDPQFLPFQDPQKIVEHEKGDVCVIEASDQDSGENGKVSFSLSTHIDLFALTTDGSLSVIGDVDRETQDLYYLYITATDHGLPSRSNMTMMTIIVEDKNDNSPVFSQTSYSVQVLAKYAKKEEVALTVSATDKDIGNNSIIAYRLSSVSNKVELNSTTGVIKWAEDYTNTTEDEEIQLEVIAEDHGTPSKNATAKVTIELRASLLESVTFENSTYFFSLKENEEVNTDVGVVKASSGNQLVQVTYALTTDTDLFELDTTGALKTLASLDKEKQDKYILDVKATDTRIPPNTATATVVVTVEDVNESPVFESEIYQGEIYSIAPFKFPIMTVKASDPDVGDGELTYSLEESDLPLEVESSTGLIYVLDVTAQGGKEISAHVKATDKGELSGTAEIKVNVKNSASDNIVIIVLNKPVYLVEQKAADAKKALENILGWTVNIISMRAENGNPTRSLLREMKVKTLVSFIALDESNEIVNAEEVRKKLQEKKDTLKVELQKVFGTDLELEDPDVGGSGTNNSSSSNEVLIIVLGVLFAVSLVALIVVVAVMVIKLRKGKHAQENFVSFENSDTRELTKDGLSINRGELGSVRSKRNSEASLDRSTQYEELAGDKAISHL